MARSKVNPYSYFNSDVQGISPTSYWGSTAQPFFNPQYGIDTTTGKRDSERVSKALVENPFAKGDESTQFPGLPSYGIAEDVNADLYESLADRLAKKNLALEGKQQLLGLGSGLAFSAASLPFVERLRNLDYSLGLQADIESPTAQTARDVERNKLVTNSLNAQADYLRAIAAVRQGAASGVNVTI